jgi:NADH:ubiquinone oxidoreductase subunit F (NADH-binding)/NADH:ubiquinone oxidoreductase subunit E
LLRKKEWSRVMQQPPNVKRKRSDPSVAAAVAEHGRTSDAILPVLQSVQATNRGHLDAHLLGAVADALDVNDARIYGVASFYSSLSTRPRKEKIIRLCDGPVCMLQGGEAARAALESAASKDEWTLERCSCLGLCDRAPAALVASEPCGPITAGRVGAILDGWRGDMPSYAEARHGEVRVAMARVGKVEPDCIESALASGAYRSLHAAMQAAPVAVLDAVEQAGLRGCGGAGFPTARKWRMVREAASTPKYIVGNADESEPGAFKDRVLMESDPHLLLEGMALAGYAVGASAGVIYIRGEYEWISRRLQHAVSQAQELGWLGTNIQGAGFSFHIKVHRGAGASICGEEKALLNSLEGRRGEPRLRPPYPTARGYNGRPTLVNNVETLCHVPAIISRGPQWFRSNGTAESPGTKVFTVTGCVNRPGAFETPFGVTLRQVLEQFGGGLRPGTRFKAALTGGAAGSFAPASMLDVPIDFASWKHGPMLGSGPILILDESVSIPRLLSTVAHFFQTESCGKCTPCREGTREVRKLTERFAMSRPSRSDLAELKNLARQMNLTSLCGLGQSIAWPVESALEHFEAEFLK